MKSITKHLSRCLVAGIVALLPIAGVVLTVAYVESSISASFDEEAWYFAGLGILASVVLIYIIGLIVSSYLSSVVGLRVCMFGRIGVPRRHSGAPVSVSIR